MNEFPPSKAPRFEFAETLEEPENQLRRNPESGRPPSTPRQTAAASRTGQDSASAVNPPVVGMPATRRGERGLSVFICFSSMENAADPNRTSGLVAVEQYTPVTDSEPVSVAVAP